MNKFAKELLFFLLAVVIGLPVGFIFIFLINVQPVGLQMSEAESVFEVELYIVGVLIGLIGTYFARLIIWAIKKVILNN